LTLRLAVLPAKGNCLVKSWNVGEHPADLLPPGGVSGLLQLALELQHLLLKPCDSLHKVVVDMGRLLPRDVCHQYTRRR